MAACPDENRLLDFAAGCLAEPVRREVHLHLEGCEACRAALAAVVQSDLGAAATNAAPTRSDPPAELPASDADRYEGRVEHARGGQGRIVVTFDRRLRRRVAIKELLHAGRDQGRFVREALLTAQLQHPAIVPVHDIGRWPSGEPFFTMKLVSGRPLSEVIERTGTVAGRLALLPHAIAVADAIAYAHSEGIVHRDLKPSNVLVGEFGETVVIDWGLAKDLRAAVADPVASGRWEPGPGASAETMAGAVMGTLLYMPPEQARGEPVDERADVYALGALLYHLLAGHAPYLDSDSAGRRVALERVREQPPTPLAVARPEVPADLAAIVGKAMARLPEGRYPSARQLSDDLRRFQTGQLVAARRYAPAALAWRWLARHRATALATAVVALLVGAGGILWRARARAADAAQARHLTIERARAALVRDPTEALAWLARFSPGPPSGSDSAFAGFGLDASRVLAGPFASASESERDAAATLAIEATARGAALHVFRRSDPRAFTVAFSPDGGRLVVPADPDAVEIRDVATGARLERIPHPGWLAAALFSPTTSALMLQTGDPAGAQRFDLDRHAMEPLLDGAALEPSVAISEGANRRVAALAPDGSVLVQDPGRPVRRIAIPAGARVVALSDDGRWIGALDNRGGLVLDPAAGAALAGAAELAAFAFAPDGGRVAGVTRDALLVWELPSGRLARRARLGSPCNTLGWSRSGRIVTLHAEALGVFSPDAEPIFEARLPEPAASFDLSPDGTLLAAAGPDGAVWLWPVGGRRRTLRGHAAPVANLIFSPDSHTLASLGRDGSTRLWRITPANGAIAEHDEPVHALAVSPDGALVASGARDGTLRISAARDRDPGGSRLLGRVDELIFRAVFLPGGRRLVTAGLDGAVRVWDVASGAMRVIGRHDDVVWAIAVTPDGGAVLSASADGTVRSWPVDRSGLEQPAGADPPARTGGSTSERAGQPDTGGGRLLARHPGGARCVAVAPDGRTAASGGEDRMLRLAPLDGSGTARVLAGHGGTIYRVAFLPDGAELATGGFDGEVRLWSAERSGRPGMDPPARAGSPEPEQPASAGRLLGRHRDRVRDLAVSPDGALIATASEDHTVSLWARPGAGPITLSDVARVTIDHPAPVERVVFLDAGRVATAAQDGGVRVFSTGGRPLFLGLAEAELHALVIAPDRAALYSGDERGGVRRWPLEDLLLDPARLGEWIARRTTARVAAAGELATP